MKILLCIVLLLVVLTLFAVWPGKRRDALRAPFLGRNCAHRGFFGKEQRPPENSLPAFAAAAKNGYGIELDVQFTADRRLVVFHDDTLDRDDPGQGLCARYAVGGVLGPAAGRQRRAPASVCRYAAHRRRGQPPTRR